MKKAAMNTKKDNKNMKMDKSMNNTQGDDPIITAPMIDKLSGVANFTEDGLNGVAFSTLIEWIDDGDPGISKVPANGKYQLAVKMRYPDADGHFNANGPFLLLQMTNPKVKKRQMRFEYNPAHMTAAGEEWLNARFTELLDMDFYQLLFNSRFTRIDWCRNIMFRNIEDYLIYGKWKKESQCHFSKMGQLQTITLGKAGNNQLLAYDKAARVYGDHATHGTIRVEVRCRINMTIKQLQEMEDPFKHTVLYSIGCKNPPHGQGHWRAFQDSCRLRGILNAIKVQPVQMRPAIKKALSKLPVEWWAISDDDWGWLKWEAFERAGLNDVPEWAPPLILEYQNAT